MNSNSSSFKKLAALFSLLALGAYGALLACSDYFTEYDFDSSFTPEAYADASYAPLFYSPQEVFYRIGFDESHVTRFNEVITAEWSAYLKDKITPQQLTFLLLNDSAQVVISQLRTAIIKKEKTTSVYNQLNLNDEKIKGFIEFMYHARIIEKSSTEPPYSWNYNETKKTPVVDTNVIAQVEKLFTDTKDPFLKNRYWFQTMKAYFYSKSKPSIIAFFDKTKASVPLNNLYYRGVAYVAGAYYSSKNYSVSNYLYSIVFDKCPELRVVTAYNFHPQEQADFQASLALAKTTSEKAALWSLFGYYADTKIAIAEIYKIDPASSHLDYLLTRLVNQEEVSLSGITFTSADDFKRTRKEKLDKESLQLVSTIAAEGKTTKPYLWDAAAGYLNVLAGNHTTATQFFDKAEKQNPKTTLLADQLRLLRVINTVSSFTRIDEKAESRLLPELTWLYNLKTSEEDVFRYHQALTWSRQYIAALYTTQKNVVLSELFNRNNEFYHTSNNLEAMKLFLKKPVKSDWEQLASAIYDITLSDIYEYQAVMSAYADKLDEAIIAMEQSENGKNLELPGNPFNGKIKDCNDCDHAAPQKTKYTRLSFLKKLQEMKSFVVKGEDVYNNSLLLGNAFYNMSYFGNARAFYEGSIMNQYSISIDSYYQTYLLNNTTANQYYQKAFAAATTDEQKAKCTYMMAKCERNAFYTEKYYSHSDWYGNADINFLAWNGFKKLRADYSNTKYYKDVITECGYFKTYAGK